jgi:CBS domain containing-hemolysin-like protein
MIFLNIAFIFVLIGLNGFFVAVEFAAVASRRARLDLMAAADSNEAKLVRAWLEDPSARERLIAATQLGITLVSLALGAVGEKTFAAILEPYFEGVHFPGAFDFLDTILPAVPLVVSLTLVTAFHVVLGEQVPKVAVLRVPEQFALAAAPVMQVFNTIFKGFIDLLDWATRMVLKLLGLPATSTHATVFTAEEIKEIVSGPEVEGVIEEPERKMLSAVLDFGELVVRQVSLPRTEIVAVEADQPIREAIQLATEHAITKMPVYEDNLDQVIGIVHVRDILARMVVGSLDGCTARDLAREALFVPETISVNDLLREFRARRMHIAIVMDEFGGTYGLVTLEDLLEEIFGEVGDPFDHGAPNVQPQPDGSSLLDGMMLIDEVNEHFGLSLSDPNYDTIAGYILGKLGRIPKVADVVEDPEQAISLQVTVMDHLRIAQVSIRHLKTPEPPVQG